MIKRIILFILFLSLCNNSFAWMMGGNDMQVGNQDFIDTGDNFPSGRTFVAIYDSELNADIAVGSKTATFAASRDATHPATYFDSSGVMQVTTTSNVGRFDYGFYDTSGWTVFTHAGVIIESAATNEITYSDDYNQAPWAPTNVTVGADSVTCVDGTARTTNTLTASAGNGTLLYTIAAAGDARTFSVFLKRKTGTGSILISADNDFTTAGSFTTCSLSTAWRRFTIINPAANGVCGIKIVTNTDAIYACHSQFEDTVFASSPIPTTSAALTRNAETLKYVNSGNRTAATESCVVKLAPGFADSLAGFKHISDTDTIERDMYFNTSANDILFRPNHDDSVNCLVDDLINDTWTANTEMTIGYAISHTSPYIAGYYQGVPDGTNETTDDFINPAWGTYFWVGCKNNSTFQLNGTILGIAFFNRVLSDAEMLDLHNKDWRTLR